MITLVVNGITLESNVSYDDVRITYRNAASGMYVSFLFDLSIPATAHNLAALNHPNRPNRLNRERQSLSGQLYINNKLIINGLYEVGDVTETVIEINIEFVAADFINNLGSKMLNEILDEQFLFSTKIYEDIVLLRWPDTPVCFPSVYNPEFFGEENPAFGGIINNAENSLLNSPINSNVTIPMLYIAEIVKRVFTYAGYDVTGKIFSNPLFTKAWVYNNFAIDELESFFFKGEKNSGLVSSATDYIVLFNEYPQNQGGYYNSTTGRYLCPAPGNYKISGEITHKKGPWYTSGDFYNYTIKLIATSLGVGTVLDSDSIGFTTDLIEERSWSFDVEFSLEDEASSTYLFLEITYQDENGIPSSAEIVSSEIYIRNQDLPFIQVFPTGFNIKNHVPKMQAIDFINAVLHDYKLVPIWDNIGKTCNLISFGDFLSQLSTTDYKNKLIANTLKIGPNDFEGIKISYAWKGPDSFTDQSFVAPDEIEGISTILPSYANLLPNKAYYVDSLRAYITLKVVKEPPYESFILEVISDEQPEFIDQYKGFHEEEIQLNFSPMPMRISPRYSSYQFPAISGKGTSVAYNIYADFPLRISWEYGFGGYTNSKFFRSTITMRDNVDGLTGLPFNINAQSWVSEFWSEYLKWRKRRQPIKASFLLTQRDISVIDLTKLIKAVDTFIIADELYLSPAENESKAEIEGFTV